MAVLKIGRSRIIVSEISEEAMKHIKSTLKNGKVFTVTFPLGVVISSEDGVMKEENEIPFDDELYG